MQRDNVAGTERGKGMLDIQGGPVESPSRLGRTTPQVHRQLGPTEHQPGSTTAWGSTTEVTLMESTRSWDPSYHGHPSTYQPTNQPTNSNDTPDRLLSPPRQPILYLHPIPLYQVPAKRGTEERRGGFWKAESFSHKTKGTLHLNCGI